MVVAFRNFQSALGAPWDESPSPHEGSDWWNQQKIGSRATEGSLLTAEDKCDRNREGEQLVTKERTVLCFGGFKLGRFIESTFQAAGTCGVCAHACALLLPGTGSHSDNISKM